MMDPRRQAEMLRTLDGNHKPSPPIPKSPLDRTLDKQLNDYIDTLGIEAQYAQNPLVTPAMKRATIKNELKEGLAMTELQIYINKALGLLLNSSPPLLTLENGEQLKRELVAVVEQLESPQFDYSKESFLQQALQISGSSVAVISDVAKRLFSQQQYDDALALYSLLSTLDPGNADCWFQLGMCAQESEKWDLAIRAYGAVIQLAPEFIGAYLFSIECHLKGNDQQAANETWKKAKQIAAANDLPDEWREAYNLYATAFEMLEKQ